MISGSFGGVNLEDIDFAEIYEGIPKAYWHNCILSLEDGIITYELAFAKLDYKSKCFNAGRGYNVESGVCDWQYSQHILIFDNVPEIYDCTIHTIISDEKNPYNHIYTFLGSIEQAIKNCMKYDYDFGEYLGITSKSISFSTEITFSLLSIVCYKGKLFTKFIYGILLSLIMIAGEYICIVPFTTKMIPMTVNEDMNTLTAMLFSFILELASKIALGVMAISEPKFPLVQSISKNLIHFRKLSGMTQTELAEKINYSDKSISKWERGDGVPDIFVLTEIAEIFGVTVNDFLSEESMLKKKLKSKKNLMKKNQKKRQKKNMNINY